jgi:hypothetical protein
MTMQVVHENATFAIVNITGSDCAAGISVNIAFGMQHAIAVIATHRHRPKARCADSESRFLAINKFSRSPASRLIAARQNGFFAGITAADSARGFSSARCVVTDLNDRCMPARA